MKPWLLTFLVCQDCGGELGVSERAEVEADAIITGILSCDECALEWPVLAGVPLLLSEPSTYLSSYRDPVLATLAEHGRASVEAIRLIDEFSEGHIAPAMRFGDDWTAEERLGGVADPGVSAHAEFRSLVRESEERGLEHHVLSLLEHDDIETLIEVGPGAGLLSKELASRCQNLILIDHSLRSLMVSAERAREGGARIGSVLADAGEFELVPECSTAVVAANVVDLISRPERFLRSVSRWLVRGGELIVTTPDPGLGEQNDDTLGEMLKALEFSIDEQRDGIPWLRVHGARYSQLYWLQALRASV